MAANEPTAAAPKRSVAEQVAAHAEALDRLRGAANILVATHSPPDPDGLGSAVALARGLRALGKRARVLVEDRVPRRAAAAVPHPPDDPPPLVASRGGAGAAEAIDDADLLVLVDAAAFGPRSRIGARAAKRDRPFLAIDHHRREAAPSGDIVIPGASSCGEVVLAVLDALGAPIDTATAEAVLTALVYDTQSYRFVHDPAETLTTAARLVRLGADAQAVQRRLFQSGTRDGAVFSGRVLSATRFALGGALAHAHIAPGTMEGLKVEPEDFRDAIQRLISIARVEVALTLNDSRGDGTVRVSLRAKAPVDVEPIARELGGGGHPQACGAVVPDATVEQVFAIVRRGVAARLAGEGADTPTA